MADGSIVIDSEINDKGIDDGIKGIQGKLGKAGDRLKSVGTNMSKYVTVPIVAAGAAAFKAADDIDKAMQNIRVGTGATGEDLDQLETDFKTVFKDVPASADEVSNAIANLNTMTGESGKPLQEMTYHVLEASRMLGEDGVSNSEAFGKAMAQWQVPAEKGPSLMDSLYKSTQDYGVGLGDLLGQLNAYGPIMQNAGYTTEETADFFGRLNKAGISVSRLMPGLNKAFRDWSAEGKDLQTELGNTIEKIRGAESETDALRIATEAFGAQGAQRMVTAIKSGAIPVMEEWGGAISNQTGLISDSTEENKTFGENMKQVWNEITLALEPFGEIILQLAKDFLPPLTEGLSKLSDWLQDMSPHTRKLAVGFAAILAAAGPLMVVISSAINVFMSVIPVITSLWNWLSKLRWIFTAVRVVIAALSGPVGIAIAIISALIAVGVALYKNWDKVKEVTVNVWNSIRDFFSNIFDKIKGIFGAALKWILDKVGVDLGSMHKVVKRIIGFIKDTFKNSLDFLKALVKLDFAGMKEAVANQMGNIRDTVKDIWNNVKDFFSNIDLFQVGKDIIQGLINGVGSMAGAVLNKAKEIAGGIVGGIKKVLRTASPSKETMYEGEMAGEGVEKGIDKMIPSVIKKAQEIGQKAIPDIKPAYDVAIQGAGGGSQTTNRTVNLNYGDVQYRDREDVEAQSRKLKRLKDRTMLAKGMQV